MKTVQTELSEAEHRLLEAYAKRQSRTISEVVREAILNLVLEDRAYEDDPIFREPPVFKARVVKEHTSVAHDRYLYGESA